MPTKSPLVPHLRAAALLLIALTQLSPLIAQEPARATPSKSLKGAEVGDQDDLCFWRNPTDASKCLVIASDKKANRLFTYDLSGNVIQTIEVTKPGNIDIRQGVQLGGKQWDLVAVNSRAGEPSLRLFAVDKSTGQLSPVDGGGIATRPNYGGCLGYDKKSERLWFFCTSEEVGVTQYELTPVEDQKFTGQEVRRWDIKKCEGAVADDSTGALFVAEEQGSIWRIDMFTESKATTEKVATIGENGLEADLEGMTLATLADKTPVLIVSSQKANKFCVYERQAPWKHRGEFRIEGASDTDGIDLLQTTSIPNYEGGIFACHTAAEGHPILLTSWNSILKGLAERPAK